MMITLIFIGVNQSKKKKLKNLIQKSVSIQVDTAVHSQTLIFNPSIHFRQTSL